MVENSNESKMPSTGEFIDVKKYVGVASINILAINPDNSKLRKYGWTIPENAEEPSYAATERDGKKISARVRFLVQIQDLPDKPIIALDFWCRPETMVKRDGTKFKAIDAYGRTAWGTKDEVRNMKVPVFANGKTANISTPYKPCHYGEEELIQFLAKYLNITPLQIFDRKSQSWVATKNPGRLTIDSWAELCNGNKEEIARYVALQPDNHVKVVLGIHTTEDNKSYQTFMNTVYIGNGAMPDRTSGEYSSARKAIDKFFEGRQDAPYIFEAAPVHEWSETASVVTDNSDNNTVFNTSGSESLDPEQFPDDLPFC